MFYEDDLILPLDLHTFNIMYVQHFKNEVIKLISNYMPIFDKHMHQVIKSNKDPTKSDKWDISKSVSLKDILSGNQHRLTLTLM